MWRKLEPVATAALALSAVAIAFVTVRREVRGGGPSVSAAQQLVLVPSKDWGRILSAAMPVTSGHDSVHIVEFTDLECPACRFFHLSTLKDATAASDVVPKLSIVHFPLRGHRFAEAAATAAECAYSQARGQAFIDEVFRNQDSLGVLAWTSFAVAAQIPDTLLFQECIRAGPSPRVRAGAALASELGLRETPTIFVNGQRLSRPPSSEELRSLINKRSAPPSN